MMIIKIYSTWQWIQIGGSEVLKCQGMTIIDSNMCKNNFVSFSVVSILHGLIHLSWYTIV